MAFIGAADLGNTSSSPWTVSYTEPAAPNGALVVCVTTEGVAPSMTYGGTSLSGPYGHDSTQGMFLFYLLNPATGANNLVISFTGGFVEALVSSYSGVQQSSQPDGSGTTDDTGDNNTFSGTYSTTNNNAWVIGCAANNGGGSTPSTSGLFTTRATGAAFTNYLIADSGPVTTAGSVTFTATIANGGAAQGQSFLSLLPINCQGNLSLLGVGC